MSSMLLAMATVSADVAWAGFQAGSYPAAISGTQIEGRHDFKTAANELSCNTYDFDGELSGEAKEIALTASPSECTTFGFIVMTVSMNGCTFDFGTGEELGGGIFAGSAGIACPKGQEIVWTSSFGECTARVPPQTFEGSVTLETTATEPVESIRLQTEVTGIRYTLGPTSGCFGFPAPGEHKDGVYEGITTLTAADPETSEAMDLTVE